MTEDRNGSHARGGLARLEGPDGRLVTYAPAPRSPVAPTHRDDDERDQILTVGLVRRALAHWWAWALPASLLLTVGACAVTWYTFEPVYRAAAIIQVQDRVPSLVPEWERETDFSEKASARFVQTQIELLRSPLVIEPLLSQPEIAGMSAITSAADPVAKITKSIAVEEVDESELYEVSCRWSDPEPAALLVNSVLESYFRLRSQHEAARSQRVIELLDQEKQTRADAVQRLRERMRSLGKEILGRDPFADAGRGDARTVTTSVDRLQADLADTEVKRRVLEVQIQAAREDPTLDQDMVPESLVEAAVHETQEIVEARALIEQKRAMLHRVEMVAVAGKNDPAYLRLAREIVQLERSLDESFKRARPRVGDKMKVLASLKQKDDLRQLDLELKALALEEEILRSKLAEERKTSETSSDKSLELEFIRAELAREERVFEMIAERSTALKTQSRAPERVTLLERAEPPLAPLEKLPFRQLFLATVVGMSAPFGLAVLWEILVRRISDTDQLGRQVHLPVIAEVAHLPTRSREAGRMANASYEAYTIFEESVESLRTALVHGERGTNIQVLAVSSAVSREGKTSIASQMAVSLARASNAQTLLIDGDMRSPDIHRIFGVAGTPGLAELLDGQFTIDDVLITDWNPQLHILPAGRLAKSPHELTGTGAFGELLDQLRERYRYIIIDTPPVLSASEALVMARESDGALLCAMRNVSREEWVRRAMERLHAVGVPLVGSVLNAVPTRQYTHRYGRYSYVNRPR